jgi:hypothetical protein
MLLLGMFASLVLAVNSAIQFIDRYDNSNFELSEDFIQDLLVVIFIAPCLMYFVRVVKQYGGDLRQRRQDIRDEHKKWRAAFKETLRDMDKTLEETNQKCAGFAEQGFQRNLDDFIKFLNHEKNNSRHRDASFDDEILPGMITLCTTWFRVFEQCSLDPFGNPVVVVKERELRECDKLDKLYDVCLSTLKPLKVAFISQRIQSDRRSIEDTQSRFEQMGPIGQLLERQSSDIAQGKAAPRFWGMALGIPEAGTGWRSCFRHMSWLNFGCRCNFHIDAKIIERGWPKIFRIGCGCLILLSPEHVILIMGFLAGWAIVALEFMLEDVSIWNLATMIVTEFCLLCTLIRFEAIDILQRLEKEAQQCADDAERIRAKKLQMEAFWTPVQNLTDLWLYRTTPCMDLLHELHNQLEGQDSQEIFLEYLTSSNVQLNELFKRLGSLHDWANDGMIVKAQKQQFGEIMTKVVKQESLETMMQELSLCYTQINRVLPEPPRRPESFLDRSRSASTVLSEPLTRIETWLSSVDDFPV